MITKMLSLPPVVKGISCFILSDRTLLRALVNQYGSPLHLIFPSEFANKIAKFQSVFSDFDLKGKIFFATKANKSDVFLSSAIEYGIGIDVASREEIVAALASGAQGSSLMATGPDKSLSFQKLAVMHESCIAVDNVNELHSLVQLALQYKKKIQIVLRFRPETEKNSRFGMPHVEILAALDFLKLLRDNMTLCGFSFHLNGYDIAERARQGAKLIEYCNLSREMGFEPTLIDLGGGWPISYVTEESWQLYMTSFENSNFHADRAPSSVYPYYNKIAGADSLRHCLEFKINDQSLANSCRQYGISIAIEPGRTLLDQAGFSVFRVISSKNLSDDYGVVIVEGQSFSLSEQWFGSEFLPEPFLVTDSDSSSKPFYACVAGSSCLDVDFLSWRKIAFPSRPVAGDLIIYHNTAGYQMDSNESMFHRIPIPKKIAVWEKDGAYAWTEDTLFHQSDYWSRKHSRVQK